MGIFRAIGFIIVLLAIRILMPEVFSGLEETLLKFFASLQSVLSYGPEMLATPIGQIPHPEVPGI